MSKLILGNGLLGAEFIKQTGWDYISRNKTEKFDFTKPETYEMYSRSHTIRLSTV